MGTDSAPIGSTTVDLFRLIRIAWQRKLILLASVLTFAAIGFAYLSRAPITHIATARVLVERRDIPADKRAQLRFEPAFVETQAKILGSHTVVQRALASLDLADFPSLTVSDSEDPVFVAANSVRVTPVDGAYVLNATYRSSSSNDAVRILDAIVESYREFLLQTEKDSQLQTLTILTEKEKEIRAEIDRQEVAYRELMSHNVRIGAGEAAGQIRVEYLANLGRALADAKSRRLQLENQVAVWKESQTLLTGQAGGSEVVQVSYSVGADGTNSQNVADSFTPANSSEIDHIMELRELQKELAMARQQAQQLDSEYGGGHPAIRGLRSQTDVLESRIAALNASVFKAFGDELAAVKRHEAELESVYAKEVEKSKQIDMQTLDEKQAVAKIDRLLATHDSILSEIRNSQTASDSVDHGEGVVHVTTLSSASSKILWPIPIIVLALAGIIGASVGFVLIMLLETRTEQRISPVREVQNGVTSAT